MCDVRSAICLLRWIDKYPKQRPLENPAISPPKKPSKFGGFAGSYSALGNFKFLMRHLAATPSFSTFSAGTPPQRKV
jgi:hypothetical protein